MAEFIQVMTAIGSRDDALKIAESIVGKRLAACAQVIGPITSTYWWQGAMETTEEWLCLAKTRKDLYKELEQALRQAHTYDEPATLPIPFVDYSHMVRPTGREKIDLLQTVGRKLIHELLRVIHRHTRRRHCIQCAQTHVTMIGMNLVRSPGIKSKKHLRLHAPYGIHQLAAQ